MKKSLLFVFVLVILIGIVVSSTRVDAKTLAETLKGRILLQVEENGEAWYVYPVNLKKYYLGKPADALKIMKELGLGATHAYITKHTVFPVSVLGKILLDVEDLGKAYYIYPKDGKGYYLGKPADAFNVMRELGLGITNANIATIKDSEVLAEDKKNSTALTWQKKIENLVFKNYQKTTDKLGNLILSDDNFKVILPDINAEYYGRWRLKILESCHKQIKSFFGKDPYVGYQIVDSNSINNNGNYSSCCGSAPEYSINGSSTNDFFLKQAFGEGVDAFWKDPSVNYNYCPGGHEEVHRFVHLTKISNWANEGLATYLEKKFSSASPGYFTPPNTSGIVCGANSFNATPFEGGPKKDIPFRDLTNDFNENPRIYSYYTAACFWDYVENKFGIIKVREILNNLYTLKDSERFIKNAVVPAVGDNIWDYLKHMGITPENDL